MNILFSLCWAGLQHMALPLAMIVGGAYAFRLHLNYCRKHCGGKWGFRN